MNKLPLVSIVIATYNRRDTLKVTLNKLALQSVPPVNFDVLVVDDGSDDGTSGMVESMVPSMPYSLKYLWHKNQGPGFTQNRGISEAGSKLVLLIADDIWASPELLEQHLKTHAEYPEENVAVLGRVRQSSELPKTAIHRHWDPFRYYRYAGNKELDGINFLACNISVKRDFLLSNGLYKEAKGAAHEDIELGYRLRQKGLRIIYNDQALADHYHVETLSNACRRAYERGLNFYMLSENIPKSFIFPLYHICSPEAGLKTFVVMLPREAPRAILFNRWSVNFFWLPILRRAENSIFASLFASRIAYRGVVGHFQRQGYRDWKRKKQEAIIKKKWFQKSCRSL